MPLEEQIRAWERANRKMAWGISRQEFTALEAPPEIGREERMEGFTGAALFYGFGDDGQGCADAVLSGRLAWEYALRRRGKTWHCEYVDFDRQDHIRLRPGAPPRPKGFYYAKYRPGDGFQDLPVALFRRRLKNETGCASEGLQLLAVTHRHFLKLMNEREMLFMALADYDVAPYGFNDFFDALQLFCSMDTFGLGIGNVDRNCPGFGIPAVRLPSRPYLVCPLP